MYFHFRSRRPGFKFQWTLRGEQKSTAEINLELKLIYTLIKKKGAKSCGS